MEEKIGKLQKYTEWGVSLLLVILTGYFSATLFLNILSRKFITAPQMAVVKKAIPEKEKTKTIDEYLQNLKALFPEAVSTTSASQGEGASGGGQDEQQNAAMKLVATILGDGSSLAVINVANKDEVVGEGQTVGQYTVKEITKNLVMLENGGREMTLKMKFGEPDEPKTSPQASRSTQVAQTSPGVDIRELSRREFEELTNPPDKVARDIGFAPVSRDNRPYGIQLTFVKPGSLFQKLGFLPGDILKTVNKKPVYSPEDAMMVYQMMKNEDTVDFSVDRGGRFTQIQFVFK